MPGLQRLDVLDAAAHVGQRLCVAGAGHDGAHSLAGQVVVSTRLVPRNGACMAVDTSTAR
jgi:hypothetical protein